jgi:hypothetical protein
MHEEGVLAAGRPTRRRAGWPTPSHRECLLQPPPRRSSVPLPWFRLSPAFLQIVVLQRAVASKLFSGHCALGSKVERNAVPVPIHDRNRGTFAVVVCLAAALFPLSAHADLRDQPFALRVFFTVDRQSNYVSTLGRQASIAFLDGSSANPGAAAWKTATQLTTTATASYLDATSTSGHRTDAIPISLRWQFPEVGTLGFAYAYTDTPDAQGNDDMQHALRSNEWIAGYGARTGDNSAAGFTVRYTSGEIASDSTVAALGNQTVRTTSNFTAPDIVIGIAGSPDPRVSVGLDAGYGVAHTDSLVKNVNALILPLPPPGTYLTLPPGTILDHVYDTVSIFRIRAGAGFKPNEATGIYIDANGLYVRTQRSGSPSIGRFALGVEHYTGDGWTLRGGTSVDTMGQVNWSAGIGYRLAATVNAEFAVQSNGAPELNPELGRTRLIAASLGLAF